MWPFRRKQTPDEVLGSVNKGVLAAIGSLQQQLLVLEKRVQLCDENATAARSVETKLAKVDAVASSVRGLLEDHVSRLDQAVVTLRGQITGGQGGRPRRGSQEATAIGTALIESLGVERAAQLANEVVDKHNGVSNGSDQDSIFA